MSVSRVEKYEPIFACSSMLGYGIGISINNDEEIENLSNLAPESPFNFINLCQLVVLK
jgi:hypothetical protein